MDDQQKTKQDQVIREITPELKATLNETRAKLKGSDRRRFMAQIVLALGQGGQSRAQRELGWNRNVIEDKNYTDQELPKERTIRSKLNALGFKPQKVAKAKPLKKTNTQMTSLIIFIISRCWRIIHLASYD